MRRIGFIALGLVALTAAMFLMLALLAGAPVASPAFTSASAVAGLVVGCWAWRAAWTIGRRRSA